jgi:voltage-gated potassium channel
MVDDAPEPTPLMQVVATATVLFYLAEHEQNPQVKTFWDAFHYISTCMSVGYANLFPVTDLGKLIGGMVMLLGPAMGNKLLPPSAPDVST